MAGDARRGNEKEFGHPVITSENAVQLNTAVATMIEDVTEKYCESRHND